MQWETNFFFLGKKKYFQDILCDVTCSTNWTNVNILYVCLYLFALDSNLLYLLYKHNIIWIFLKLQPSSNIFLFVYARPSSLAEKNLAAILKVTGLTLPMTVLHLASFVINHMLISSPVTIESHWGISHLSLDFRQGLCVLCMNFVGLCSLRSITLFVNY